MYVDIQFIFYEEFIPRGSDICGSELHLTKFGGSIFYFTYYLFISYLHVAINLVSFDRGIKNFNIRP